MLISKVHQLVCLLLIISSILVTGCGKLGENEAEKIVINACKVPNSFEKISYEVDEKNGIAYMDFSAKNSFGMIVKNRAYFVFNKDKEIIPVDTSGISENILADFIDMHPSRFLECTVYYKDVLKAYDNLSFPLKSMTRSYNRLEGNLNFYTWKEAAVSAKEVNTLIKKYHDLYYGSPSAVQKQFDIPPKYFDIQVEGTWYKWSYYNDRTYDYPKDK